MKKRKAREYFVCYGTACRHGSPRHIHNVSTVGEKFGKGLERVREVLPRPRRKERS